MTDEISLPDKPRERYHFEALRRALSELVPWQEQAGECPDFLLFRDGRRLGIEFTVFHLPAADGKSPHQEQESLKKRIVETAERLHHELHGPALYVSIFFCEIGQ